MTKRNKFFLKLLIAAFLLCLLSLPALAQSRGGGSASLSFRATNFGAIHHQVPDRTHVTPNRCFPFTCGGITEPKKNPDPDSRKPENLAQCMYDGNGTLFYERAGATCSYKWGGSVEDKNVNRVEQRRQEWLVASAVQKEVQKEATKKSEPKQVRRDTHSFYPSRDRYRGQPKESR